jgi:hypothetical protein
MQALNDLAELIQAKIHACIQIYELPRARYFHVRATYENVAPLDNKIPRIGQVAKGAQNLTMEEDG